MNLFAILDYLILNSKFAPLEANNLKFHFYTNNQLTLNNVIASLSDA